MTILPDLGVAFVQQLHQHAWYARFHCGCALLTENLTRITRPLCPFHTPRAMTVIAEPPQFVLDLFNERLYSEFLLSDWGRRLDALIGRSLTTSRD